MNDCRSVFGTNLPMIVCRVPNYWAHNQAWLLIAMLYARVNVCTRAHPRIRELHVQNAFPSTNQPLSMPQCLTRIIFNGPVLFELINQLYNKYHSLWGVISLWQLNQGLQKLVSGGGVKDDVFLGNKNRGWENCTKGCAVFAGPNDKMTIASTYDRVTVGMRQLVDGFNGLIIVIVFRKWSSRRNSYL